jgi:hypothetical protein
MNDTCEGFLKNLALTKPANRDLAIAAIWWHLLFEEGDGLTIREVTRTIEKAGYPKQNATRLAEQLRRDQRTRRVGKERFGISVRSRARLTDEFKPFVKTVPVAESDSVLPAELFRHTRTYIERVVKQINASFDAGLYDCTAVMCRRLLETLIIEVYERQVRAHELKGADGQFQMLSGLLDRLENDSVIHMGREATKGLKTFKKLGDLSAHNRRFNARADDIGRVRDSVRIAAEELLHLAWPVRADGLT